jgi:hypothetical protein
VLNHMENPKADGANQGEPVGTSPLNTTNLGVRSSNLFGRASSTLASIQSREPILRREPANTFEFLGIGSHHRRASRVGMSGDQEIVASD